MKSKASMTLKGRVGAITYYSSDGRQISRASQNSSNYGAGAKRTELQQNRRVRWANLVNMYKASKSWMYYAFEYKKPGVSDYNKFMSLNVDRSSIALTKNQAASGGCVVEGYQVTEGSLMPVEIEQKGNIYITSIAIGLTEITDDTTIAQFSASVIGANSWLSEGMQISFISYQQTVDRYGIPRVICTPYELTLDIKSLDTVRAYLPVFCSSVTDGYLSTNDNISVGAFCYVLSKEQAGRTIVSTQYLIPNNTATINSFSSNEQIQEAIKSYKVDGTKFLQPGSSPTDATLKQFFIVQGEINGLRFTNAPSQFKVPDGAETSLEFIVSSNIDSWSIESIELHGNSVDYIYLPDNMNYELNGQTLSATGYWKDSKGNEVAINGLYFMQINLILDGAKVSFGNGSYPMLPGDGPSGE